MGASPAERLPYDLEAEKAVLGSILRDPRCVPDVQAVVEADDFYLPRHRGLFFLMSQLDARSAGSCDPVTVAHEVELQKKEEELGGRAYLEELMASVPSLAFLENHLRIVRDLSLRRRLLQAAEHIQRQALESPGEVRELLDLAEQEVLSVGDRLVGGELQSVRQILERQLDRILSSDSGPQGLRTGFLDLDERQGFRPGDLVVLAARPSMGKTALALNIIERVALGGGSALLFSLEMPADQIILRFLSSHARVRHDALRRGRLDKTDRQRLTLSAAELGAASIHVDDSSQPSMAEIRAKARRLARDGRLDLVVVDYLQLLSVPRAESRQQEIAMISRGLKSLARDLQVPVLALAQLNRAAEQRDSHRPRLSDLRESGAIEQDADLVLLLFREEYYNPTPENAGIAELIVAKNRNGPTGTITLHFTQELMRFENAVREPAI